MIDHTRHLIQTLISHPPLWIGFNLLIGLCIGSFLNVCIYRIPRNMSLGGRSHCPKSKALIAWYDNIPVLSFLFLKGKGRNSGQPIGWKYPLVEALTGIAFCTHAIVFDPGTAVLASFLFACGIVVIGTDLSHKIIPDGISLGGAVILILWAIAFPHLFRALPPGNLPLGLNTAYTMMRDVLSSMGLMCLVAVLGYMLFKKDSLGFGDVKLAAFIGALLGLSGTLNALTFGGILTLLCMPLARFIPEPEPRLNLAEGLDEIRQTLGAKLPERETILKISEKAEALAEEIPNCRQLPFGPGLIVAAYIQFATGFDFNQALQKFWTAVL